MFNAPRNRPTAFQSTFTSSDTDPLASSAASYMNDVDPWSGVPSPSATPAPGAAAAPTMAASTPNLGGYARPIQGLLNRMPSGFGSGGGGMVSPGGGASGLGSMDKPAVLAGGLNALSEGSLPNQYAMYWDSLDTDGSGLISLAALNRLLSTSGLPASTNERIITMLLPSTAQSVNQQQFFAALGLAALAQGGKDISLDRLNQTSPSSLPIPSLRISSGASASSSSSRPLQHPTPVRAYSQTSSNGFAGLSTPNANTYKESSTSSPWDVGPLKAGLPATEENGEDLHGDTNGFAVDAADTGFVNSEIEPVESRKGWWKDLESIDVTIMAEKEGWFLQKYRLESNKRSHGTVTRRYSDFVWLLDCLTKRYPFRLLPALPPKRMSPDQAFLEQRRKGLQRFMTFVVNHPILKEDGCLGVFLAEPNFEGWRKRSKVNLDEESTQKKLDQASEASIPQDVTQRVDTLRRQLPTLLEAHARLVVLAEKSIRRIEAASADQSRMAMTMATLSESCPQSCWRNADSSATPGGIGGAGCDLCKGVGRGLAAVGDAWGREAEDAERRTMALTLGAIESLKTQRDLYASFKDLLVRHDQLSKDNYDFLRKSIDTKQKKLDLVRDKRKVNWEVEEEKLSSAIAQENAAVEALMVRRVYIKHCLWHELSVVLHSRQAAQATLGWRTFAAEKTRAHKGVSGLWQALATRLEDMPVD